MSDKTHYFQIGLRLKWCVANFAVGTLALASFVFINPATRVHAIDPVECEGETGILAAWAPSSGTRSTGNFVVSSIDQLYCLGTGTAAANSLLDANFTQAANLNWSGLTIDTPSTPTEWSIIGDEGTPFTGTYDGNGKSLTGLTWSNPTSGSDIGIFGFTSNAEIKNLSIVGVNMGGLFNVGGLAGRITSGTLVTNVHVAGAVASGQNGDGYVGDYVGGITGSATNNGGDRVVIADSSFNGTISAYGIRIGGAVGYGANLDIRGVDVGNVSATTVTVSKGVVSGNNPNDIGSHSFAGGVAGVLEDSNVDGSTFAGTVSAKNVVGGIVGKMNSGTLARVLVSGGVQSWALTGGVVGWSVGVQISDAASLAAVTQSSSFTGGTAAHYVGGIAGLLDGGTIKRAYNSGAVTGRSYVGGIAGSLTYINTTLGTDNGMIGVDGIGKIDQTYNLGLVTNSTNQIGGALTSTTGDSETDRVTRSFALEGTHNYVQGSPSVAYTIDRGTAAQRSANPYKTATQLKSFATYSTGWNAAGTNGRLVSLVDGWYAPIAGFGPYWGMCANYNNGYPFLLALEMEMPSGCAVTSAIIAPESPYDLELYESYHSTASARIGFIAGNTYGQATVQGYQYLVASVGTWMTLSQFSSNINDGWLVTGLLKGATNSVKVRPVLSGGTALGSEDISIAIDPGPPAAPTTIAITPGDRTMSIAFTPGTPNGPEITNYMYSLDNGENWAVFDPQQSTSPLSISGLDRGASYNVKLRAMNSLYAGGGDLSATVPVTMPDLPAPPTNVVVTPGNAAASVSFDAGVSNGSDVVNYEYSFDDGVSWTAISPIDATSPVAIAGLSRGASYSMKLRAVNAIGSSPTSSAVDFSLANVPSAPVSLAANSGNGQITVVFTAGSNNGAAITRYEYSTNDGVTWNSASPDPTARLLVITNLINGTEYSVKIRGVNAIGNGAPSIAVTATPVAPTPTPTTIPVAVTSTTLEIARPPKEEVVLDLPTPKTPLIEDTSLTPGAPVTMTFRGFVPGEFVQLIVASTPRVIASGYAESTGSITLAGNIPETLLSGDHSLALYAPESGRGIRQPITVVKADATLPRTGTSGSGLPMTALIIILFGVVMQLARRRFVK